MYPVNWLQLSAEIWFNIRSFLDDNSINLFDQAVFEDCYTNPSTLVWKVVIPSPNKNAVLCDSCCKDGLYECDNGDIAVIFDDCIVVCDARTGRNRRPIKNLTGIRLVQPFQFGVINVASPRESVKECYIIDRSNYSIKKHDIYFMRDTIVRIFMHSDGAKLIIADDYGIRVQEINPPYNARTIGIKDFTCLAPLYDGRIGIGFADGSIEIFEIGGMYACQNKSELHWYGAHTGKIIGIKVLRDGGLVTASQAGPGGPVEIKRWSFNGYPFSQQQRSNCVVM